MNIFIGIHICSWNRKNYNKENSHKTFALVSTLNDELNWTLKSVNENRDREGLSEEILAITLTHLVQALLKCYTHHGIDSGAIKFETNYVVGMLNV